MDKLNTNKRFQILRFHTMEVRTKTHKIFNNKKEEREN